MKTQLYTYDGTPLFEVALDETSSQDWSLMSDNKLSVSFELEECVVLTAGCYIDFDGTRFYLLNEYKPTMIYSSAWKYDLAFGDAASWLSITLALKTIDGEDTPIFKYTASAAEHAAIIVANLNRRMGTDQWKVGSIIYTENIAIDYSGKYCSDVLQEIVDAKNTEWWLDGMTLNIGRAEFGESITLGYMNGVLGDIVCDMAGDMRSYAYLFPIGSTRNIDPTKYGHDRLQLPSGLKSVPINPEQGVAELVEEAAFAHIYPRYEGTVSAVRYIKATNKDGTPFLIYYIKDTAIPFNPNEYEIAGLVKHITFNSGELMGQEFEVNYSADSNEFELITRWTGDIQLPGGVLVPAVGDKYVVWNITMPDVYYTIASHELLDAARAFAADAIKDVSVYKVKLDYIDVQERGLKLRPGQRVRLLSDEYFASGYYDSRITRITRNIAYPDELSVDISAVRVVGTLSRLQASIQKTENIVSQFSGQLPAVIKSNDESPANDDSVYTSAKSQKEFLNKRKGGKVDAPVTFADVAEFINGIVAHKYIRVGNGYLKYNDELETWEMSGNLLVKKGFAWFASIDGFNPATIMDAVQVDGETIVINERGQLKAIGGGSGGSGGGLTISDLSNYLTTNKYTKQSDVETLISTALTPYALTAAIPTNNNQLSNGAGYITEAALNGYATQSWVEGKKYLTGITSSQVTTALGYTPYNSSNPDKYIKGIDYDMVIAALGYTPYSTTNPMGYLTISSLLGYATEQWVGESYLAKSGGSISGTLTISTNGWGNQLVLNGIDSNAGIKFQYSSSTTATLYCAQNNPYWQIGNAVYNILHSGNIGSYNAGSATKLATPRTIWGQRFNGEWDLGNSGASQWIFLNSGGEGIYISGDAISWHNSSNSWTQGLMGFTADGTVIVHNKLAVGGATADAKLHVHGDILANGSIRSVGTYGGFALYSGERDGEALAIERLANHGGWVGMGITMLNNGNVGVGHTTPQAKLHVGGNAQIDGDVLVNGNFSWITQSQRSLKHITSEQGLSLAQLELIKPIKFYWKDGRDAALHVGGVADVFAEVLPEVVSRWKDTLCLNYVDAGFYVGASLIAPVVDHERRITQLEKENAELKQKLNQLAA